MGRRGADVASVGTVPHVGADHREGVHDPGGCTIRSLAATCSPDAMTATVRAGDCRDVLCTLRERSVQCVVTSPPYFGLRDYGADGQIGRESTPDEYMAALVEVFREVRRVLCDDGTVWLNLGDTMKDGNLLGMPWRVALALKADGWYLRSEIIWAKRNGLPDGSATDRPDRFHEHIFLLAKRRRYHYDADAIREQSDPEQEARNQRYAREYAVTTDKATSRQPGNVNHVGIHSRPGPGGRNKRSVWIASVHPFPGAHTATFPPKLIEPCVLAGSRVGDLVLDPFAGSGTVGVVCGWHGRDYIGIELNDSYARMARERIALEGRPGGRPASHEPARVNGHPSLFDLGGEAA